MTADRWRQVDELFHAAVACPVAERERVLRGRCGDDPALRAEVESLLTAHEHASSFIDTPAFDAAPRTVAWASSPRPHGQDARATPGAGERIGRYTLRRVLGTGGMGVVWEADQERPRRTVALKILRPGLLAPAIVRRFEHEAETLARLQHPGIAQIFEAGTHSTESGAVAYFAMELVRGEPITDYFAKVESRRAGTTNRQVVIGERLELFVKVCEAVEHAHQRGVIHRDLKPSNILVACGDEEGTEGPRDQGTEGNAETHKRPNAGIVGGSTVNPKSEIRNPKSPLVPRSLGSSVPAPKVLDFGVARTIDSDIQRTTLHTEVGQIIGTIPYMSPEQVAGRPDQIDTRSDVYSLGVILYELLSGRLPHDLAGKSLPEAARIIREENPKPLRAAGFTPALVGTREISEGQKSAGVNPAARLDADLETIVAKALEKNPARRYASVSQLASDITHYLRNEPITARPATTLYQLRKLAARHKTSVAIAGTALAAILALAIWITALFFQARSSERLAEQRAETADRVKDFMLQVFSASDPDEAKGIDVPARELLDRGVKRIEAELSEEPQIQAELFNAMGNIYQRCGEYAQAAALNEKSLDTRLRALGEHDQTTALTRADLAEAYGELNRYAEAESQYGAALAVLEETLGPEHETVARLLAGLAEVLRSRDLKQAEAVQRRALDIRRRLLGERHPDVAESLTNLGVILRQQGRNEEAEACYRQALPILLEHHGEDQIIVAHTFNSLGVSLRHQKRLDEAEEAYLRAQRIYRTLWKGRHPDLASSIQSLAQVQRLQGRYAAALRSFDEALDMQRQTVGHVHSKVADVLHLLGWLHARDLDDPATALPLRREGLAVSRRLPTSEPWLSRACEDLARNLSDLGQLDEALELMNEALAIRQAARPAEDPLTRTAAYHLGRILLGLGRLDEAEGLLRHSVMKYEEGPPDDWELRWVELALGKCMLARGERDEAEQLWLTAYDRLPPCWEVPEQPTLIRIWWELSRRDVLRELVAFYEQQGDPDASDVWRERLADSEAAISSIHQQGMLETP